MTTTYSNPRAVRQHSRDAHGRIVWMAAGGTWAGVHAGPPAPPQLGPARLALPAPGAEDDGCPLVAGYRLVDFTRDRVTGRAACVFDSVTP